MSDNDYLARSWTHIWCPSCGALVIGVVHRCTVTTTNLLPRRKAGGDR